MASLLGALRWCDPQCSWHTGLATVPRPPSALAAQGWYVTEGSGVLTGGTTLTACGEETEKDLDRPRPFPTPRWSRSSHLFVLRTLVLVKTTKLKNCWRSFNVVCCFSCILILYPESIPRGPDVCQTLGGVKPILDSEDTLTVFSRTRCWNQPECPQPIALTQPVLQNRGSGHPPPGITALCRVTSFTGAPAPVRDLILA